MTKYLFLLYLPTTTAQNQSLTPGSNLSGTSRKLGDVIRDKLTSDANLVTSLKGSRHFSPAEAAEAARKIGSMIANHSVRQELLELLRKKTIDPMSETRHDITDDDTKLNLPQ